MYAAISIMFKIEHLNMRLLILYTALHSSFSNLLLLPNRSTILAGPGAFIRLGTGERNPPICLLHFLLETNGTHLLIMGSVS